MAFDCSAYCRICIACNRAKPDRRGSASLNPLGVPVYPWEIVGIDYVTDLPRSGSHGHSSVVIMVCHLSKMAHYVPCHKDTPPMNQVSFSLISFIYCMVFLKVLSMIELQICWKFLAKLYEEIEH